MAVSYIPPLERAWDRSRRILFRPFLIEKWLVIGFGAFLAWLACRWAGMGFGPARLGFWPDFDDLRELYHGSFGFVFGMPLVLLGVLLWLLVLWLSSRGKVVFLDNLVRDRAAVVEPWNRCGRLGDSLFLWRLGFHFVFLAVFGVLLLPVLASRGFADSGLGALFGGAAVFSSAVMSLVAGIFAVYIALFLDSFIVPIMYRDGVGASDAWRAFLPLFRRHVPEFLIYGLFLLLGSIVVVMGLAVVAVATCCVVPLLLAVPYVGSVLLLPVSSVYRLYGAEFLAQFGSSYSVFASPPDEPNPSRL